MEWNDNILITLDFKQRILSLQDLYHHSGDLFRCLSSTISSKKSIFAMKKLN